MAIWFKRIFKIKNKRNNETVGNLSFQKLTPIKCGSMNYYKETLDFIFNEKDLLNIAITGAYSAGKSSVIQTYEDLNQKKKFIHISLAHFEELSQQKSDEKLDEVKLEGKIINQLIHQINPEKIPQTKFKVKTKVSILRILKNTSLIGLLALLLVYLIKFNQWTIMVNGIGNMYIKRYLTFTTKSETVLISIIICTCIILIYIYKFVKTQLEQPILKKIKWQNNEVEIFDRQDESYFDKYLDEILYLFCNADTDAIIFEDIDRYNNNIIFSKLREINYLVNKKLKKNPIRFFYLLRDDVFTSKDRTKFFDFMMPIVPIVDSSNSYDQMLKFFTEGGIIDSFDKSFLERISLYIDDMRLLKNIYNEYIVYNGRIQATEQIPDKLLAIIVYKNIFPEDFSDLQLNLGFVYNIFVHKEHYIKDAKESIELKIKHNLELIEKVKMEQLNDLDELDTLYLTSGQYNYRVNSKNENSFESRVEYVKNIKANDFNIEYKNGYDYYNANIKSTFERIYIIPEYIERKKIIELKMHDGINRLENENLMLNDEKKKIDSFKVKDLITKNNIDEIFTYGIKNEKGELTKFEHIVNNKYYPLIKYLIRNGFVDETYFDYLTYFYENNLTRVDKIFLRSITDQKAKIFDYILFDVKKVIARLKESDFYQEEVLNFSLLNYLIESRHSYLGLLLRQIKKDQRFDFVWSYIQEDDKHTDEFVKLLNIEWKELWVFLLSEKTISEVQKRVYIINTMDFSSIKEINDMNIDNCISYYISNTADFLDINSPDINRIIEVLVSLNVLFKDIKYEKCPILLFDAVYKHDLYCLNFSMINLILEKIYKIKMSDEYTSKNYTLISSKPDEPLKEYIDKNMNAYMKIMLENAENRILDSKESVLAILNNESIELEFKISYIKKLDTISDDITQIADKDGLWKELLESRIIKYSLNNIVAYYFIHAREIDDVLVQFINSSCETTTSCFDEIKDEFKQYDIDEFYQDVIKSLKLDNVKYNMILKGYKYEIEEFTYTYIPNDKMKVLIQLSVIGMTKENIKIIRNNYYEMAIFFFCSNIEEYINCLDDELIVEEEILEMLDQSCISDEYKILLIEKYPDNISLENRRISEKIQLFIMENKFCSSNLNLIFDNYMKSSIDIQKMVGRLAVKYAKEICLGEYRIPRNVFYEMMVNKYVEDVHKKILIFKKINSLSCLEAKQYFEAANLVEFASIFYGKRPKIFVTDENRNLLEYFYKIKWIHSFEIDSKEPQYYRVIGKKWF